MKLKFVGLQLIMVILLSTTTFALGISKPYWDQNPLIMYPGQEKTIELNLQNAAGTEDILVDVSIIEGSEIAKIKGKKTYNIAAGTSEVYVPLEIKVPEGALGVNLSVVISLKEIALQGDQMLRTAVGIKTKIPVVIKGKSFVLEDYKQREIEEPEEKKQINFIDFIIIIVLVLIGIYIYVKKRKK
ncbi:hypothetical protein HY498_00595 [Candidatus Woesearchaeota archaeon]|nr:hypothetical protein [Candidatus Woesearchaeota archaeon]